MSPYPGAKRTWIGQTCASIFGGDRAIRAPNDQVGFPTGVGRPIVDQLRTTVSAVTAVTITAGKESTLKDGMFYVPKQELVGALVAALENDRLQIASGLCYAAALVGELQAFRRARSPAPAGPPTERKRARMTTWWSPSRWRCGGPRGPPNRRIELAKVAK